MMMIFDVLQGSGVAMSQGEIVEQTGLARSTVYRLLKSLTDYGLLRECLPGRFVLGGRILQLAEKVTPSSDFISRLRFLQPLLDKLAADIGQTCKISVYDRGAIMVVAGASGRTPHAMAYTLGEYLPLHAGGASKVLMASLDPVERRHVLMSGMPALTPKTMTDMTDLEQEWKTVSARGWAEDPGEYSLSVCSYAAPIRNTDAIVIAALSIPFMSITSPAQRQVILQETIAGAQKLSQEYCRF